MFTSEEKEVRFYLPWKKKKKGLPLFNRVDNAHGPNSGHAICIIKITCRGVKRLIPRADSERLERES